MKLNLLIVLALLAASAGTVVADSVDVTGNPSLGGWTSGGDSLANGVFVRGANAGMNGDKRYDFTIYSTSFTVQAGSPLLANQGFHVGDQVLGLGAVVNGFYSAGAGVFSSNVPVANLGQLNAKFGTFTQDGSIPLYAPAVPGPAEGSDAAGNGGLGSAMITVGSQLSSSGLQNVRLDRSFEYNSPGGEQALGISTGTNYVGAYEGDIVGGNLKSFEFFISNGELVRQGFNPLPLGAGDIVTMMNVVSNPLYTDAFIQTPAVTPVPLPAAVWTGASILGGMALLGTAKRKNGSHKGAQ